MTSSISTHTWDMLGLPLGSQAANTAIAKGLKQNSERIAPESLRVQRDNNIRLQDVSIGMKGLNRISDRGFKSVSETVSKSSETTARELAKVQKGIKDLTDIIRYKNLGGGGGPGGGFGLPGLGGPGGGRNRGPAGRSRIGRAGRIGLGVGLGAGAGYLLNKVFGGGDEGGDMDVLGAILGGGAGALDLLGGGGGPKAPATVPATPATPKPSAPSLMSRLKGAASFVGRGAMTVGRLANPYSLAVGGLAAGVEVIGQKNAENLAGVAPGEVHNYRRNQMRAQNEAARERLNMERMNADAEDTRAIYSTLDKVQTNANTQSNITTNTLDQVVTTTKDHAIEQLDDLNKELIARKKLSDAINNGTAGGWSNVPAVTPSPGGTYDAMGNYTPTAPAPGGIENRRGSTGARQVNPPSSVRTSHGFTAEGSDHFRGGMYNPDGTIASSVGDTGGMSRAGRAVTQRESTAVPYAGGFQDPNTNPNVNQEVLAKYNGRQLPVVIRNNNPAALSLMRPGTNEFAERQEGYVGATPRPANEGGFYAKYATPEHGIAANARLLESYGQKGINTTDAIVRKWSTDTGAHAAYSKRLQEALGVSGDTPIDLNDRDIQRKILMAKSAHESGAGKSIYNEDTFRRGVNREFPTVAKPEEKPGVANKAIEAGIVAPKGQSGSAAAMDRLDPDTRNRMLALGLANKDETGSALGINSAHRTLEDQQRLYDNRGSNPYPVARPGTSKHEKGKSFDISRVDADRLEANGTLARLGLHRPIPSDPVHIEPIPGAPPLDKAMIDRIEALTPKEKTEAVGTITDNVRLKDAGFSKENPFGPKRDTSIKSPNESLAITAADKAIFDANKITSNTNTNAAATPSLKLSPAATPSLKLSPAATPSLKLSPAATPSLKLSPVDSDTGAKVSAVETPKPYVPPVSEGSYDPMGNYTPSAAPSPPAAPVTPEIKSETNDIGLNRMNSSDNF